MDGRHDHQAAEAANAGAVTHFRVTACVAPGLAQCGGCGHWANSSTDAGRLLGVLPHCQQAARAVRYGHTAARREPGRAERPGSEGGCGALYQWSWGFFARHSTRRS
ncbi:hypothetical protein GCM10023084_80600 [Streptomyces lacrimifluminis]|uniref:Uncharacterized protein n=1 Tax=Streptomyces lacrimifluminis TaxID=1500077 RepID=A0A917PCM1_9ACTN|nr:hypothetical protein GCM10012282_79820 [Streptomyces lacrimifluminis]